MNQTFHLEALGPDPGRGRPDIVQRLSLRADRLESVEAKAVRLLQRAQAPQWDAGPVEAVRILDGAGSELFRWTIYDEMTTPGRR